MSTTEITNRFPMIVAGAVLLVSTYPDGLTPTEAVSSELVRWRMKVMGWKRLSKKAPTLAAKLAAGEALRIAEAEYRAMLLAQFDLEDAVKHLTGN